MGAPVRDPYLEANGLVRVERVDRVTRSALQKPFVGWVWTSRGEKLGIRNYRTFNDLKHAARDQIAVRLNLGHLNGRPYVFDVRFAPLPASDFWPCLSCRHGIMQKEPPVDFRCLDCGYHYYGPQEPHRPMSSGAADTIGTTGT